MKTLTIGLIRFYQLTLGGKSGILSTLVGGGCLHSPTCSEYMIREIGEIGVLKGIFKGVRRILSCR